MKIITAMIFLMFISLQAFAKDTLPEVKFQLENMDENETLVWCFEIAYRLSDYQRKLKAGEIQSENEVFCNAPLVDEDQIRGYLNKNHRNQHVTDNQALKTIFNELSAAYPCTHIGDNE